MAKIKIEEIAMRTGGVAAGAVAATVVDKFTGGLNPKVSALGKIVVGAVLPVFMPKNKFVASAGDGFSAVGAADLFKSFTGGAVSGANDYVAASLIDEDYAVSGDEDYNVSGADDEFTA